MATGNITVSVEKAIHNALSETLQQIWDEHGIVVHEVAPEWIEAHTVGKPNFLLSSLKLKTRTVKVT